MQNLLAEECLNRLRKEGFDYNLSTKYDDLYEFRNETFYSAKKLFGYGESWSSDIRLESNISGEFVVNNNQYKCVHYPDKYLECGPVIILIDKKIISNQNIEIDTPDGWNGSMGQYFPSNIIYLNKKPYFALGANNNKTLWQISSYDVDKIKRPNITQTRFQPKLPKIPKLSKYKILKEIKTSSSIPFERGGWYKFESACSKDIGTSHSYVLNLLLIPIEKYINFINNWEKNISYAPRSTTLNCLPGENNENCTIRMKKITNVMSDLFAREDIVPAVIRVDINVPSSKIDLSF